MKSSDQWNWADDLRLWWSRTTMRPRLALAVLFRYSRISIIHNVEFTNGGRKCRGNPAWITNNVFNNAATND